MPLGMDLFMLISSVLEFINWSYARIRRLTAPSGQTPWISS
jgi:hypothetical protein